MIARETELIKHASVPTTPLVRRVELPAALSGIILLIGGLLALALALAYVGSGTQVQAVAWAFFVAGVIAALRKWA